MLYEKLDYILTIAEEQNLTRASKRLFISQPTLTLYLNRLEADLGVKLFDRSKSPILLTDAGNYYISKMKKIAASEQLLRNDIKFIANPNETLVVAMGVVRGQDWLPLALPSFCSIYPNVNIQVIQASERDMVEELYAHRIDVAFGAISSSLKDLKEVELMHERLCIVAHENFGLIPTAKRQLYSAANPYLIEAQSIHHLPFIIPHVGTGLFDSYDKLIVANHIQPSRIISVNNLKTGLLLAMRGLGVQLISSSILHMACDEKDFPCLDFCMLGDGKQTRKCIAAYDENNVKKKLIDDLIRIVQQEVIPQCHFIEYKQQKNT